MRITIACLILALAGQIEVAAADSFPSREDTVVFDLSRPLPPQPNFNWFTRAGTREQGAQQAMWEPLFLLDYSTGKLEPWLGESIEPNPGTRFTVWTLKIRPYVTWSDGTPFTAQDVKFTVELALAHPELPALEAVTLREQVNTVTLVDSCSVEFALKAPNPRFGLQNFGGTLFSEFLVVPQEIWERENPVNFNFKSPMGTGPYVLHEQTTGEASWTLNKDWWGAQTPEQLAKSKYFGTTAHPSVRTCVLPADQFAKLKPKEPIFKPLPEPLALRWVVVDSEGQSKAMLLANDLDAARPFTRENFEEVRAQNPAIVGWDNASARAWNDPCPRQIEINTQHEPWNDKRLRKALSLLIDRAQLVQEVYGGTTNPSKTMFAEYGAMDSVIAAVTAARYGVSSTPDIAAAEALLKDAGYTKSFGKYFQKDGKTLHAHILVDKASSQDLALANALRAELDQAGLYIQVVGDEHDDYWGYDVITGNYQMTLSWLSCGSVAEPYTSMARYARLVKEGLRSPGFDNTGRWDAELEYATIVAQLFKLAPGDPKATDLAVDAYAFLADEMPFIPLVQSPEIIPFNTKYWTGWPSSSKPSDVPRHDWLSAHRLIHLLKVVPSRLAMSTPSQGQIDAVSSVLGQDFVAPTHTAFPPSLQVAQVDLNADGVSDLVALQKGYCSNHTCTFEFLLSKAGHWVHISSVESWGVPYLIHRGPNTMNDIVYFDHLSNDCEACSPPSPVKMIWEPDSGSVAGGEFVSAGPISGEYAAQFKASW